VRVEDPDGRSRSGPVVDGRPAPDEGDRSDRRGQRQPSRVVGGHRVGHVRQQRAAHEDHVPVGEPHVDEAALSLHRALGVGVDHRGHRAVGQPARRQCPPQYRQEVQDDVAGVRRVRPDLDFPARPQLRDVARPLLPPKGDLLQPDDVRADLHDLIGESTGAGPEVSGQHVLPRLGVGVDLSRQRRRQDRARELRPEIQVPGHHGELGAAWSSLGRARRQQQGENRDEDRQERSVPQRGCRLNGHGRLRGAGTV
jgi:hypothetical protein